MRRAVLVSAAVVLAGGAASAAIVADSDDGASRGAAATGWKKLRSATLSRTEVAAARIGRFIFVVGGLVMFLKAPRNNRKAAKA